MWPSDNEIKHLLSNTAELGFDTAGYLKLKNTPHLSKLNKELTESTIDSLNAIFEQKGKLILANQLRKYIESSYYQELILSKKSSIWKNFKTSLPYLYLFYVTISIIIFVVLMVLPYIWPLVVAGVLLTALLPAMSLWLMQKIHYRFSQIKKNKHENKLSALVDTSQQTEHPVNPLFIARKNELFQPCAFFQELPRFPNLNTDELAENLAGITRISDLRQALLWHIDSHSPYRQKSGLIDALELVYYRLNGNLDKQLGELPEKASLIYKLIEGIGGCTAGFHNRVNTIIASFQQPQNLNDLLYLVRKNLVDKAANALTNEVHTVNDFTKTAKEEGLGIQPNFSEDIYNGKLDKRVIQFALQSEFEASYTLFNLPRLLVGTLLNQLQEIGYTGAKEPTESYTIGSEDSEVNKFIASIKKYLPSSYFPNLGFSDFFLIDEENYHILDVNWKLIEQCFFDLLRKNYFALPSFDDFSKFIVPLLSNKNKQAVNYLMLLTQFQPESLNLLFYYLSKYPNNETTKEIKKNLIPLFFEKNKHGQNVIQLAAQYQPTSLQALVNFIDRELNQFDLKINDLLLSANYQSESLEILFDFTDKHSRHADKQIISAFFLKKNDLCWNSFLETTRSQPKTAFVILNYILKHPEMFNSKTLTGASLFKENLSKIQKGLSNLIETKKLDSEQTSILLKFISLYPELMKHVPKKVAHFLFSSLSSTHDERLIDKLFESHATLLLNYFSINYFNPPTKNSVYILEKIACAYHAELIDRINTKITYTNFFKLGFPVEKKLSALQDLFDIFENYPDDEKKAKLDSLNKTNYKVLNNGRLGQFFKCCKNDSLMTQIKIKLPQSRPI